MITILGDIHGQFNVLTKYIKRYNPELVIQLGDFGYWPTSINFMNLKYITTPVWFIDGNHEDHFALKLFKFPISEGCGLEHIKRGTIRVLRTGQRALFVGGAASIDKPFRTPGLDWFPDEVVSEADVANLPDGPVDIVFSHTCPDCIKDQVIKRCDGRTDFKDPSTTYLQMVYDKYRPPLWYFSHWHISHEMTHKDTRFICLNTNEWRILDS